MKTKENKYYVYEHYDTLRNKCFYVGKGSGGRAFDTNRSYVWRQIAKHGYRVEFVQINMSQQDALDLETRLIDKHGRRISADGNLVNIKMKGGLSNSNKRERVFTPITAYCESAESKRSRKLEREENKTKMKRDSYWKKKVDIHEHYKMIDEDIKITKLHYQELADNLIVTGTISNGLKHRYFQHKANSKNWKTLSKKDRLSILKIK